MHNIDAKLAYLIAKFGYAIQPHEMCNIPDEVDYLNAKNSFLVLKHCYICNMYHSQCNKPNLP